MTVYCNLAQRNLEVMADDGNWYIGYDKERDTFYSVAKEGSGARDSWFGDISYIRGLIRKGIMSVEKLTEAGKKMIIIPNKFQKAG